LALIALTKIDSVHSSSAIRWARIVSEGTLIETAVYSGFGGIYMSRGNITVDDDRRSAFPAANLGQTILNLVVRNRVLG